MRRRYPQKIAVSQIMIPKGTTARILYYDVNSNENPIEDEIRETTDDYLGDFIKCAGGYSASHHIHGESYYYVMMIIDEVYNSLVLPNKPSPRELPSETDMQKRFKELQKKMEEFA